MSGSVRHSLLQHAATEGGTRGTPPRSPRRATPAGALPVQGWMQHPGVRWAALWGLWTVVGLAFVGHYYLVHVTERIPFSPGKAVWVVLGWYVWIVLTPVVVQLARRFPIERRRVLRRGGVHLALACALCMLEVAAVVTIRGVVAQWTGAGAYDFAYGFRAVVLSSFFFDLLVYTTIVAVVHAMDFYGKVRERDLRTAQLEHQLTKAQLQALRMQLNPHFLFNTLHAVHALMEEDVRRASRMLVDLSDLLRFTLDEGGEQEVPLQVELGLLERYLKIEGVRFGDRLSVHQAIEDDVREALVPNLILQPLVENAIKHGIAPFAQPGQIAIHAFRQGDALVLQVRDNGPGLERRRRAPPREGVGLRNTRERLNQFYGDAHHLAFRNLPEGGLSVELRLPFRLPIESISS